MARNHLAAVCIGFLVVGLAGPARSAQDGARPPVKTFVLTSEKVAAYGKHAAIERPTVKSGDSLHIYGEPEAFGWHVRDGTAKFHVTVNVDVRRSDGRISVRNSAPLELKHAAPSRPGDFFFSLSVKINTSDGSYVLNVRLRDALTGETVDKSFPFLVGHRRHEGTPEEPMATAATERKSSPAPGAGAKGAPVCKKYFSQIGAMVAVPCEP
jgi:hypothetical protein